jgi:hypothetical protein
MTKQGIRVWPNFEINMAGTGLGKKSKSAKITRNIFWRRYSKKSKEINLRN